MSTQRGWRWCQKCQGAFYAGNPDQGVCPADNMAHDASQSGNYAIRLGEDAQRQQGNWRACRKCQGTFYAGGPNQGVCSADHQAHDGSLSFHYAAVLGDDAPGQQGNWRWCKNCQGMFYGGGQSESACPAAARQQAGWRWCRKCQGMFFAVPQKITAEPLGPLGPSVPSPVPIEFLINGVCPADNKEHDGSQGSHYSVLVGDDGQGQQGNWRWCLKCQGLFFAGGPNQGVCQADHQPHDGSKSGHYALVWGDGAEGQQGGWRWCQKCQGMFFAGGLNQGLCPADRMAHDGSRSAHYAAIFGDAGVLHDGSASGHYAMPWDTPEIAHIHDNVTFPSGVAAGGWFDLAWTGHGDVSFSGHFHDSGADSYDITLAVVLMTPDGLAYSVAKQGHVAGTFQSGSRDLDWAENGQSNLVARNWDEQFALAKWRWGAYSSSLIGTAVEGYIADIAKQLAAELGTLAVGTVIALL